MNVLKMIAKEIATFVILGLILIAACVTIYFAMGSMFEPVTQMIVAGASASVFVLALIAIYWFIFS